MHRTSFFMATVAVSSILCATSSVARDLTLVGPGGTTQAAMTKAWAQPYEEKTGNKIVLDEGASLAKIRAMVEAGSVQWDIVELESPDTAVACNEGLIEKTDVSKLGLNKDDFVKGTLGECGFPSYTAANVLAYDADRFPDGPQSWADFWDVQKFPGKRGFYNTPKGTLEAALMADGVPQAEIYDVLGGEGGVDRAFKKLDELKPNIVWWNTGAEMINRLASGDYAMTYAWNGRITNANIQDKRNFKIAWNAGYSYVNNNWVIPQGSENKEKAEEFFKVIADPDRQAAFMNQVSYSAPTTTGLAKLSPERLSLMPLAPENLKYGYGISDDFWTDNYDSIVERFNAWAAR